MNLIQDPLQPLEASREEIREFLERTGAMPGIYTSDSEVMVVERFQKGFAGVAINTNNYEFQFVFSPKELNQ